MVIATILIFVALILGWAVIGTQTYIHHLVIGIIIALLLVVQAFVGYLRTGITSTMARDAGMRATKQKYIWIHRILGRLVWAGAVANIFFGVIIAGQ